MLAIGRQDFEKAAGDLQFQLTVFVYDASDCRPEEIIDVSGVKLVMNAAMRHALRGLTLDFDPEGFFFLGADGLRVNLSQR